MVIFIDPKKKKPKIMACKDCGKEFEQIATSHLSGDGCPKCGIIITANKNKKTTSQFIQKAQKIHGKKYNYSKSIYIGYIKPLIIICPKHGEFIQKPIIHINGSGCPKCGIYSKGEMIVENFLNKNQINFETQKLFDGCVGIKRKLPFDFYLPDHNILIEYDGIQHFKPVKRFGGENGLSKQQKNDKIKNLFAKENNIILIRVKYNEKIEIKLKRILL